MQAARVNGVVIRFADEGDRGGRPVVFANSLGTDLQVWDRMIAMLPEGLRTLRLDKRGHGLSECPAGGWSIEDLADDLIALMDRQEIKDAVVVGLSIGGLIAQSLAARRPDLCAGLVLMDTAAKIGDAATWNDRIAAVKASGLDAMADGVMERWFSAGFRSGRPEELAVWRAMLARTPPEGYAACCAAIRDADLRDAAPGLSMPTLAICGDEDGATTPEVVKATADMIPGARFELIQGAGHLPCVEQPAVCTALLTAFMEEHRLG